MGSVLLINPPWKRFGLRDTVRRDAGVPHPGILSICETLINHDHDVAFLDISHLEFNGNIHKEVLDALNKYNPSIVGISATTCSYLGAVQVAKEIKGIDNKLITIGGGIHFALNYKDIYQCDDKKYFDFIAYEEGEQAMANLVEYREGQKNIEEIPGVAYLSNGSNLKINEPVSEMSKPQIIRNAWDILDISRYKYSDGRAFGVSINTVRGCSQKCTFCSEPIRWRTVTEMDAEDIVDQLSIVKAKLNPDYVYIGDSTFNLSTQRLQKFLRTMMERDIHIPYSILCRADLMYQQRELLPLMRETGNFMIFCGGERVDGPDLEYLEKNTLAEVYPLVAKAVNENDILLKMTFIFGLPHDDKTTIAGMADKICDISPDIIAFASLTPWPGTPLSRQLSKYVEVEDLNYYTTNNTVCNTDFLKCEEVEEIVNDEWINTWNKISLMRKIDMFKNSNSVRFLKAYYDSLNIRH